VAHAIGSNVTCSYWLTSMLELRRPVLASWSNDVTGSDADNVVPLRRAWAMVIDPQHEGHAIEALRKLRQAKGLVDHISEEIGDDGGKRERLIRDALTSIGVHFIGPSRGCEADPAPTGI
jgi:hypothetical protein